MPLGTPSVALLTASIGCARELASRSGTFPGVPRASWAVGCVGAASGTSIAPDSGTEGREFDTFGECGVPAPSGVT
eukprot:1103283-Prymnesium_polylepis.1